MGVVSLSSNFTKTKTVDKPNHPIDEAVFFAARTPKITPLSAKIVAVSSRSRRGQGQNAVKREEYLFRTHSTVYSNIAFR